MTDLINFVIRCTGCSLSVNVHDIEDPDNALSKLSDLQDEYNAQKPTDYPLISRRKDHASFRSTVTGFFETLIQTCHASGLLYSDLAIIENIEVWVSTMSSSGNRPFRHTATVISLAIGNQLCHISSELTQTAAQTVRQKESEQKQKKPNKERIKQLETKQSDLERRRVQVRESLTSVFEAVYVHRYRDVDPKIRVECVTAMGNWIVTFPDFFFEGTYLRYLGWVLSDIFPQTRAEDIKQLIRLYKNKENIARLRTFTERFRSRLVEMAMQDSEVGIRASTVELLGFIREAGLLEPSDIDSIGRLIFDTEPRVRKAVTSFFAKNIEDIYEASIEELGGLETLQESLQDTEDEYGSPRLAWLKLKSIVEALQAYDAEDEEDVATQPRGTFAPGSESRYASAAQTICEGVKEAKEWETIVGYLLYDFSAADAPFEQRCQLNEQEQAYMLEVLIVSVKQRLLEAVEGEKDKKGKQSKARKQESTATQEATALHLAKVIPDLLQKFGANPATTSAVLRLGHTLNLKIFQELREDSTAYASLLDDINKQFLTHADSDVLAEASSALLYARNFEDLEEVTEGKVQELWDDTINVLRVSMSVQTWVDDIEDICDAVRRIAHLASIMDCTTVFQAKSRPAKQKKKAAIRTSSAFDLLIEILQEPGLDAEAGDKSDDTLTSAMKALLLYYMWLSRSLQEAKEPSEIDVNSYDYSKFSSALITIAQGRHPSSLVRTTALCTLLDLHTLFATFRHKEPPLPSLIQPVDSTATPLILSSFIHLEKSFAKKAKKKLELSPDDDVDSAPEDLDDEDEEDVSDTHAQQETLLAEQRLCQLTGKIVLAIVARVLDTVTADDDPQNIKNRLGRNLGRHGLGLGANFKAVLEYLPHTKPAKDTRKDADKSRRKPPQQQTAGAGAAGNKKSKERVDESDESDDDDGAANEEGGDEDLRERELEEDPIEGLDDDDEEDARQATAGAGRKGGESIEDEDEIMGD